MLKILFVGLFLWFPTQALAAPEQVWQAAMMAAKQGHANQAMQLLRGAQLQGGMQDVWVQRFDLAVRFLALHKEAKYHSTYANLQLSGDNQYEMVMASWLKQHPMPPVSESIFPGLFASVIPGSGHAWLGRWADAGVAAMLVWPLLILTFWAARRDMGPVTVFFALITAWLWSGTVFSAVSLAERGDYELYYAWWQEMWVASGLPSRPW